MEDKTNFGQSLMHIVKGNLGTGILAMPASFAHAGLVNATIGLPILCLIATYCVHLLIDSTRHLESKTPNLKIEYSTLAKHSFKSGPWWMQNLSNSMCRLVDGTLLLAQIGACCVYLVFVTENIISILGSYRIHVEKGTIFMVIFPIALGLSYIRTLSRLAIASTAANLLEVVGITLILQFLLRGLGQVDMNEREKYKPLDEIALGFGSAMFAFEGISIVLPVYSRIKYPERMSACLGVINVAFAALLSLYFIVGLSGFLRFGNEAGDSITLNLPPEPLYDIVRAVFMVAVFLTYPLQFYVPNEIIWNFYKKSIHKAAAVAGPAANDGVPALVTGRDSKPTLEASTGSASFKSTSGRIDEVAAAAGGELTELGQAAIESSSLIAYEYACRTVLVVLTFALAVSVPKLNLLMDLIGSITGTLLSFILPAMIHLATFWDETRGASKLMMLTIDLFIILFGSVAGVFGATSSVASIMKSFNS